MCSGRRAGPGPVVVALDLAAQLAPDLELDDLRRPLGDRTWNGVEMAMHRRAPL
jgi:hypothetical protein